MSDRRHEIQGYRLVSRIGEGGMGEVYLAHDINLDKSVAIKLLRRELAQNQEARDSFLAEARHSARLEHPNIADVKAANFEDGQAYIVMELLRGQTLRKRLEQGPLPGAEAVQTARAVLAALAYAHQYGVVHCDIKPENVFLCENGVSKVVDFGIARARGEVQQTDKGMTLGTPAYMSPEQAQGREADPASDLYSVGILLYEMLTGDVPFKAEDPKALLEKHVHESPPPLPNTFPPVLRSIVARALRKSAKERFPSAQAMAQALATYKQPLSRRTLLMSAALTLFLVAVLTGFVLRSRFAGGAGAATAPSAQAASSADAAAAAGEVQQTQKYLDDMNMAAAHIKYAEKQAEAAGRALNPQELSENRQVSQQINDSAALALQHAERAIELDNNNADAYYAKASALYYKGSCDNDFDAALDFVNLARSKFPADPRLSKLLDIIRQSQQQLHSDEVR
jgi:tRNA A-37 threonylcarbamoyl transferase component Bud32